MIDTNYSVKALEYLLDKECLTERYYPLIPLKKELIEHAESLGCKTKNDIASLSDEEIAKLGLTDEEMIRLLRRFLNMYEPNPQKFKEIDKQSLKEEEQLAFRELYYLPGVKYTRAMLYYYSGFKALKDIADSDLQEILNKTAWAISEFKLSCIVPLPKEVRTHIAVARAFTQKK